MNKRNYELTLNVTTGKIKIPSISIYNTDKGIFNIKLFLEKGEGKNIVKLTHDEIVNYKALFQAVKSKTKNYVELEGILDETENFFYYDLGSKFNDQVGVYNCQMFITDTNGTDDSTTDDEVVTSVPFNYTVMASILTGLNAEIEANPDLPVLKELINECKILMDLDSADMSVLDPFQKKEDNAIDGADKNIISNINSINSQIKDIANEVGTETLPTTSQTLKGSISELFQNVSNGKQLIATAITDKGVDTSSDDTFQTMANNINNITGSSGSGSSGDTFLTKPIYKEVDGISYRLVYNEEFEGDDINLNYWTDDYMISRVEDAYEAYSDAYLQDSTLHLRIKKKMGTRKGSSNLAVSSIQSAQKNGLHMPDYLNHDIRPFFGIISQEGYYECRMKVFNCGGSHTSWWTAGVQDTSEQVAEFDITEILGSNTTALPHNLHTNGDPNCTQISKPSFVPSKPVDFATDFHVVGFLWENGVLKWYIDGVEVDSYSDIQTPQYPMMFFLTAYKCQEGSYWGGAYDSSVGDVEFLVDYMKIYKKANKQSDSNVTLVNQIPIEINEVTNRYILDTTTGIIKGMPSYCYLNWSDGSRTEHWVKWERFDNDKKNILENGGTLIWKGKVHNLGTKVIATINVEIGKALVFESNSVSVAQGSSIQITGSVVPEDSSITTINYTVDNSNCTISANGMTCTITGVTPGISTITATIPNTDISTSIAVTIKGVISIDISQKTFTDGVIVDNWGSLQNKDTMCHSEFIELSTNKKYTLVTYLTSDYPDARGMMTNSTSDFSTHKSITSTVSTEQVEINGTTYKKATYTFTTPATTYYLWINKRKDIDISLCSLKYE